MASLSSILTFLAGIIVGTLLGIVAVALSRGNTANKSLCPRCSNETEEEKQLRQTWEEQQKGYNN